MREQPIVPHAMWLYHPDIAPRGVLYAAGGDHPGDGWGDTPFEAPAEPEAAAPVSSAALELRIADLEDENAQLKAQLARFDPDGDGKAGGSKPKSAPTT